MADSDLQAPQNALLHTLEHLGEGTALAQQIFDMIGHSKFFADFTREDVQRLTAFMQIYRAEATQMMIREGDIDDYMQLIIQGRVEIVKIDSHGHTKSGAPRAWAGERAPGHLPSPTHLRIYVSTYLRIYVSTYLRIYASTHPRIHGFRRAALLRAAPVQDRVGGRLSNTRHTLTLLDPQGAVIDQMACEARTRPAEGRMKVFPS